MGGARIHWETRMDNEVATGGDGCVGRWRHHLHRFDDLRCVVVSGRRFHLVRSAHCLPGAKELGFTVALKIDSSIML